MFFQTSYNKPDYSLLSNIANFSKFVCPVDNWCAVVNYQVILLSWLKPKQLNHVKEIYGENASKIFNIFCRIYILTGPFLDWNIHICTLGERNLKNKKFWNPTFWKRSTFEHSYFWTQEWHFLKHKKVSLRKDTF